MGEEGEVSLSERQEQLLIKWIDGEGGWLNRFYVRHFLAAKPSAQRFIQEMLQVKKNVVGILQSGSRGEGVDLWERISVRLDQEEQAEIFLGNRPAAVSAPSGGWAEKFVWGACGACVTAALAVMLVVLRPSTNEYSTPQLLASSNGNMESRVIDGITVSSGAYDGAGSLNHLVSANRPSVSPAKRAWEMDWIHSAGRVHLVEDSRGGSAVIWVKKGDRPGNSLVYSNSDGSGRLVVVDKAGAPRVSLINNE